MEHITKFAPYESPAKAECIEDLEKFLTKEIEDLEAMKMNNFILKDITMLLPSKESPSWSLKLMKESSKKKK